ncbi:MAG: hypothetical protein ICV63_03965 [Coleofasciculus sp. Co-bin14]|nr:hypothetical protein [Coleofasciculus sp. Co-bin14]
MSGKDQEKKGIIPVEVNTSFLKGLRDILTLKQSRGSSPLEAVKISSIGIIGKTTLRKDRQQDFQIYPTVFRSTFSINAGNVK